MAGPGDFEQAWLAKFANSIDETVGDDAKRQVMECGEHFYDDSDRRDVIEWSRQALKRLASLAGEEQVRQVMTACACRYPVTELEEARRVYRETGNLAKVHGMLRAKFEAFLRDTMGLDDDTVREVVDRGWGLAGIRQRDTIIATKIPKSGNLVAYLNETDPDERRRLYCHCPRIREVLRSAEPFPPVYCYCGAGFYKAIWEEILQRPVTVEVLESVMAGDEVCKIAIHLA
jgi:hypothetical protein